MISECKKAPLVSVVMTTYNGSRYLRPTIDSILRQSLEDFEFVIVDDCSTDDSVAMIEAYADPRIVFVRNPVNLGISESRNAALRLARGTLIATTDQDDVSEPDRLMSQVRYLESNPSCSAVATKVYLLMGDRRMDDPMPIQTHPVLIHFALFFGRHNTTYSSLCLRRQFIVEHELYFRKQYHYAEDYELFSRMMNSGSVSILPEALVGYRLHTSNNSKIHYDEMSRNGMSFMRDCFATELGRTVEEHEGWRIWHGLIEKRPHATLAELRESGRLVVELSNKFVARHATDEAQAQLIKVLAAQIWHEIVDRSIQTCGPRAGRVRNEFVELLAWSPTRLNLLKAQARGLLGWVRPSRPRASNG